MTNNKKNLIVTLADDAFINQAKQLFASVYLNASWQGEHLLLAHNITSKKLQWFRDRGIHIYKTSPLDVVSSTGGYPPAVLSKLYLFKEYFKKWNNIIFLDADIIVREPLDYLVELNGFNAPKAQGFKLRDEFIIEPKSITQKESIRDLDFEKLAFTTGIMSFNSNIIESETFNNLINLYKENKEILKFSEESTLNLYFYNNWNKLPVIYNFSPQYMKWNYNIKAKNRFPFLYHFFCFNKPWEKDSNFFKEWSSNLEKAEKIKFSISNKIKTPVSEEEIKKYMSHVKWKITISPIYRLLNYIYKRSIAPLDKSIGELGLLIKKHSPSLYRIIKLNKDEK